MTTKRRFFNGVKKPNQSKKPPLHKDYLHQFPTPLASLKDELEGKVKHYEKNISAYRREYNFYGEGGE